MQLGAVHERAHQGDGLVDEPYRILEIISPAGFEGFFAELVALGGVIEADPEDVAALSERYGLETVPEMVERFGVQLGVPL